jgi:hypothetical protein
MVNPSHDEPFQAGPSLRDEQPRQEEPVAGAMADQLPLGEGALGAMAAPVDTLSPAMATTMVEKPGSLSWRDRHHGSGDAQARPTIQGTGLAQ